MQVNSLVKCLTDFEQVRKEWGFKYPYKNDILTISAIESHPVGHCRRLGINLLWFHETPELVGVCDKDIEGIWNFMEIQPPMEISIENFINEKV